MKKLVNLSILLLTLVLLTGCDKDNPNIQNTRTIRSFVLSFWGKTDVVISEPYKGLFFLVGKGGERYNWFDKGEAKHKYDEYCLKIGDMSYNRKHTMMGNLLSVSVGREFSAESIQRIEVVSDAAWDDTHPAGSSLNDVMAFLSTNPLPYIASGYSAYVNSEPGPNFHFGGDFSPYWWIKSDENMGKLELVEGRLSDIDFSRYTLLGLSSVWEGWGVFRFISTPTKAQEHELTFTISFKDGGLSQAKHRIKWDDGYSKMPYPFR